MSNEKVPFTRQVQPEIGYGQDDTRSFDPNLRDMQRGKEELDKILAQAVGETASSEERQALENEKREAIQRLHAKTLGLKIQLTEFHAETTSDQEQRDALKIAKVQELHVLTAMKRKQTRELRRETWEDRALAFLCVVGTIEAAKFLWRQSHPSPARIAPPSYKRRMIASRW